MALLCWGAGTERRLVLPSLPGCRCVSARWCACRTCPCLSLSVSVYLCLSVCPVYSSCKTDESSWHRLATI